MFRLGLIILVSLISLSSFAKTRYVNEATWQPNVKVEVMTNDERDIWGGNFFVPLWQNKDSVFFTNIITNDEGGSGFEGNFGLGWGHELGTEM